MDMIKKAELQAKAITSGLLPDTKDLSTAFSIKNAERTGDEDAAVGSCWKEYWQIFTREDFPSTCPFCGQPLKEEDIDGCHVNIKNNSVLARYSQKKYIIPGHHACNMQLGEKFGCKINVKAVEAIEK